jgi:hypothetical protein
VARTAALSALAVAVFLLMLSGRVTINAQRQQPADPKMNFFVSSVGLGRGGDLGGVAGADKHCLNLAAAAGSSRRVWRAYLSAPRSGKQPDVHARERIGRGPWFNARGVQIAATLDELHGGINRIAIGTSLTETGARVASERHDILTGSTADGRIWTTGGDATCRGWTSAAAGRAAVGHHDRIGGPTAWNSAHLSSGCSVPALRDGAGDGLIYCFAAD